MSLIESSYRSLFEHSLDGILLTAPGGEILAANPALCRMLGYTEQEVCELGRAGIVDLADPRLRDALAQRRKAGGVVSELTLIAKDRRRIPVVVSSNLFVDDQGHERTSMLVRDISDWKRAEESLRQGKAVADAARQEAEHANAVKSSFLTAMSHDLRTPLTAILGYADLLLAGVRGPISPTQADALGRMHRAGMHLLRLIDDILNFAKLQASQVPLTVTAVRVTELLDSATAIVEPLALAKGLTFARPPCDPRLAVRGDRERLLQILVNLLSNAVKFTDAGGRVLLEAAPFDRRRSGGSPAPVSRDGPPPAVTLTVSDTGRGLAPAELTTIFEPFVQVGQRLAGKDAGTGLGLAISRRLARAMGGDVTVESAAGIGSTFTLTVPTAASPE